MKNIPKNIEFKTPEGYFEALPDRILKKRARSVKLTVLSRFAAAAVVVLGAFLLLFNLGNPDQQDFEANLDNQVELYISSGYWQAEDVLSLSDDPDALLDMILANEWVNYESEVDAVEFWEF
ncbi:hypothetical protein [Pararhodonellum marinum]|uniref:hypothetical protein n=1 Tax=Pararhodonellum marinum TaxID=2755358 RepID=UPI00188E70F1|nr:hypothetical protein [Pararhodonellum marinum]